MTQLSDIQLDIQTKLLRATFLNNMAVMQKHMPEIFEFYKNYSPTRAKLTFDHNGEINMVSEGALVYEEHAKENSYKQAEAFYEDPQLFSYQISRKEDGADVFEHAQILEKIYQRREQDVKMSRFNLLKHEQQIDLLTMIGVGLGYHIERLFQLTDIRCFYLFEPDPDCFYCAMHCVDFGPMIERCFSQGGAFTIKIGGNANQYVNGLSKFLSDYGVYNLARFFNYRHYRSEMTDKTFQTVYELAYRLSSGWGFFEDEIISIIHTLSNAKEQYPYVLNKQYFNNLSEDVPVFIIGNGPSLDETIEYIKENQTNAVIFSCGTALKPILDAGILPDFHVEMERAAELYQWIDSVGHKDKLKEINIIALNTVFTDILKLFKKAYILSKPKDGGTDFLYEFIDKNKYPSIAACNPTVSNAASAAAVALGFKKLFLFGVDYGYIDEKYHHSKGSIYYQKGSHAEKDRMAGDMRVEGNFVDEVYTTQHFDSSRATLEILLESNPDVSCFNCSNGAKIYLTESLLYQDIPLLTLINDKNEKLQKLLNEAFSFDDFSGLDFYSLFARKIQRLKTVIKKVIEITSVDIHSRLQLTQLFASQYKYVKSFSEQKDTMVLYRFLQGSLNYFQANIMTNAYMYKDKEEQITYIKDSLSLFHEHLWWLYRELEQSYDKPSKV